MEIPPDVYPDPLPHLVVERGPKDEGVGRWVPEDKHRLLANYLTGTREAWKKWPHRVFIDPFCGPGRIQVKGENFTRDGGAVMAWRKSVEAGAPFTQMLVGDIDEERSLACVLRLQALGAPVKRFTGPAAETVKQMAAQVPKTSTLSLAYLDPYNLELLYFSIFQDLAGLKADFAIHFSTMDQLRNLEFEFDPARARFDETAPGWRERIDMTTMRKSTAGVEFFNYWCNLIRSLGLEISREMPLVKNDSGHVIYRLIFSTRHRMPSRVWDDIARGKQRELF